MVFQYYSSTLALTVLRVVGWFPYRWGDSAPLRTAQGSMGLHVPRSWPWFMWSLGVGTLCLVLCGVEANLGYQISFDTNIPTLMVSRSLYDIFRGVIGFIMCLYALVYNPRLALALRQTNQICRDLEFRAGSAREILIFLLLVLYLLLILLLCSIELALEGNFSLMACSNSLFHLFKNVFVISTTILYNNCIYILTEAYSRATERITERKSTMKFESKENAASLRPSQHEASQDLTEEDFDNTGRQILRLQSFHDQLNSYFSPAIVMTVALCVFTDILSLFNTSLFPYLHWKARTFTCVYLFLSTQPLFILTNTFVALNTKVQTPPDTRQFRNSSY